MQNFRVVDEDLNVARPVSSMLDICSGFIFKLFLRYSLASEGSETLISLNNGNRRYIYIARCQVVVKLYRDLYFGYSPQYRSCRD